MPEPVTDVGQRERLLKKHAPGFSWVCSGRRGVYGARSRVHVGRGSGADAAASFVQRSTWTEFRAVLAGLRDQCPTAMPVEFERACHDEAWGCAYSRVWRAYLEVNRDAA